MPMLLNEEQTMLKEAAAKFARDTTPVDEFRRLRDEKDETGFSREVWKEMAEMGWASTFFPEDLGGLDFGYKGLGVVLEETGRTLVCSPLMSTVLLCGSTVLIAGNDEQKEDVIPAIAGGERILAMALEEGPRHNPAATACRAEKNGAGYKITGNKEFVLDGHVADQLVVVARTSGSAGDEQGITLFLVDANASGITRTRTIMTDSRNAANIALNGVEVDASAVLGEVDGGFGALDQALDRARIGLAAEMIGALTEVFNTTIEYLKTRIQFDVAIGSFQGLQHRAADMFGEIEMATAVVAEALTAIDEYPEQVPVLASLAKAKLNDVFERVSSEAVQMHGGIGMTDECNVGFYLKRSRVATQTFGDSQFHRDRYAALRGY